MMSTNFVVYVAKGGLTKALRAVKKKLGDELVGSDYRRQEYFRKPSVARRLKHYRALKRRQKYDKLVEAGGYEECN
jgi:ribosomal protein S21